MSTNAGLVCPEVPAIIVPSMHDEPKKKPRRRDQKPSAVRQASLVASNSVKSASFAIEQIENLDDLRKIDLLLKQKRRQLVEQGATDKPFKSLAIKTIRDRKVIYEQWYENGKLKARYLGDKLPPGYDLSTVSVSAGVKEKLEASRQSK